MATCPTCRTHYSDDVGHCTKDGEPLLPDEAFGGIDQELVPGDVVGEYRIEGKLGEGGFGTVYSAVHPLIGKKAALKMLHRQYSTNPQMVSRFIAEARAVNQIRHRNIIDIFSFGALPDGRQYYLMELLDGSPFDEYLKRKGRLPPEQALPILRTVARALDAAHAAGIAHRDLKPENIFLCFDEDGAVIPKLLDFGIAKLLSTTSGGHKTRTGAPMGTPAYMSPEQCRGQNIDHRTDIYAFGVLCHQVLTGRLPFDGDAVMDILVKHMTAPPPRASQHNPELKPELDAPIAHMLAKEPGDRPATLGAAVEELYDAARRAGYSVGGAASGGAQPWAMGSRSASHARIAEAATIPADSVPARTLTPAESEVKTGRSRSTLFMVGALVLCAGVAGVGTFYAVRKPASVASAGGLAVSASASPTAPASASQTAAAETAAPPAPTEVGITFESVPADAGVFEGDHSLGAATEIIKLPVGNEKVRLTLKAKGYLSKTVDVVPSANAVVQVTLPKAPAGAGKPKIPGELADPNL